MRVLYWEDDFRLRDGKGPESVKIAVFAENEAAAVFDGENGFRGFARLQVSAADHIAVNDLDPLDIVRLQHRVRHRADHDFKQAVIGSGGRRDMLFARAVGVILNQACQAASAAGGNAVVPLFAGLKRFKDYAALDAFPDCVRFLHHDSPSSLQVRPRRPGRRIRPDDARVLRCFNTVPHAHGKCKSAMRKSGEEKQKGRRGSGETSARRQTQKGLILRTISPRMARVRFRP